MSRYQTTTREVPVDQPRNTVYAATGNATGELNSQHRVTEHPAGFRIRERGVLAGTVVHAYRCPVHGVFEASVPRSDVPDALPCPEVVLHEHYCEDPPCSDCGFTAWTCEEASPWAGSSCGIGHAAGEVMS